VGLINLCKSLFSLKCTYILFHCSQTGCLQSPGWLFDDSLSQGSSLQQLILEWWCALSLFGGIHGTIVNCYLASASVNYKLPLSSVYQISADIHCHLPEKSQSWVFYLSDWRRSREPQTLRADSHIACCAHAVPLPCRAAKGLECVFPIWFTQCGRV
jgi:hypothetical protein